jgi:hypothetical protein
LKRALGDLQLDVGQRKGCVKVSDMSDDGWDEGDDGSANCDEKAQPDKRDDGGEESAMKTAKI